MGRVLAWLSLLVGIFWVLRRALAPEPPPSRTLSQGRMVRDRICETFLPEKGALRLTDASGTHYFCSAGCRDRFVAQRSA